MKKILFILFLSVASLTVDAQVNFMGIPVDGTKTEMVNKLKQKEFRYNNELDMLSGEFNGRKSNLSIVENKGKVYRICVLFGNLTSNESEIIQRFNSLYNEFCNSNKYVYNYGEKITESERIWYEMNIHNKIYECGYTQINNSGWHNSVWFRIGNIDGDFIIVIYYDNELNAPHGEDL